MDDRIKRIVIVGGGTAGWMSACYLNAVLATPNPADRVEITLIESPDIGIIGVGEATLAHIKRIMLAIGIDEADFMRSCDASFKNAIKFVGFHRKDAVWWHPFTQLSHVNAGNQQYSLANLWLEASRRGFDQDYATAVAQDPHMCDRYLSPKRPEDRPYDGLVNYAYHIDTVLLGRYLRQVGTGRGVRHVVDLVTDVRRHESGNLSHVSTKEHGDIAGDLFIDCSGFRGLLVHQALGEPFVPYNDVLFNDAAVAMRVPNQDGDTRINPHTTCTAQGAGWIWDIPLYRRSGVGHVYASAFMEKQQAEDTLRQYIGPGHEALEAKHIPMRIGRSQRAWVNNVIAVGLSGGFIEPLESTGIYLAELGLVLLQDYFPTKSSLEYCAGQYNRHMASYYEEIRDFICMHYCLTARNDTDYWRTCAAHPAVPESLQAKLALWRTRLPSENDLGYTANLPAFSAISYTYVLAGMRHLPHEGLAAAAMFDADFAQAVLRDRQRTIEQTLAAAPDHWSILQRMHHASVN